MTNLSDGQMKTVELSDALLLLENKNEAERFLLDLCTPQEIKVLQERWRVVQLLSSAKFSYREISQITGASLTTIGRVARFLKDENNNGYKLILEKCEKIK